MTKKRAKIQKVYRPQLQGAKKSPDLLNKADNNTYSSYSSFIEKNTYKEYDVNTSPLFIAKHIKKSATLASCVELKSKFIYGAGFEDKELGETIVNQHTGLTVNELVRKIAYSLSAFGGFGVKVGYKMQKENERMFQPDNLYLADFKRLRKAYPDDKDFVNKYYLLPEIDTRYTIKKYKVQEFTYFKNKDDVILEQIASSEKNGNKVNWNGQMYWYHHDKNSEFYPCPNYLTILEDAETELEIKKAKNNDLKGGFSPTAIITVYGYNTNERTKEEEDRLKKYYQDNTTGTEGSRYLVETALGKDQKTDVDVVPRDAKMRELYEYVETSCKNNVYEVFSIPKILYGKEVSGKLGTSTEMQDAVEYVQKVVVKEDQHAISNFFKALYGDKFTNYNIKNLSIKEAENGNAIVE